MILRPLVLAALLAMSAMPAPAETAAALPSLPARLAAPTDTAQFRRVVLPNGMRVILVSDPKFNRAGASLVVNTGQIDDPKDLQGLAHFLEHMLFLGTEKYPDVSDYGNFIRANGGSNNAYTSSDHTNYQFQIRHEAFAGALDRFAQFFISPTFNADFTGREVNAVHNEAMRHVQNDFRRYISVSRELYDQDAGEAKFSTGNKDTLAGATPAKVRAFYEATYTADRMALALAGKASLDELEKLAREHFSAVPRRAVVAPVREPKFLPRKATLRLAFAEPVKELRQLNLEFVIPATRPDFLSKPDVLVNDLIGWPGEGGLVDRLKKAGLIVALNPSVWERTGQYGSLLVQVELTPEGQQKHLEVLREIFSYLQHLRDAPFPAAFYKDRARVALLNESYANRGEGSALATKLANQALFYPLEVAERATDVWGEPDEKAYRRLLDVLKADNVLVTLMAKGLPTDKKDRIYQTPYSYREDASAYAALANPPKVAYALPGANRFMPGQTTLLAERPALLVNEPGLRVFHSLDTEFQRPQTSVIARFVPVRETATADNAALMRLYIASLADMMAADAADAEFAGITFQPEPSLEGVQLTITGYGDSAARFARHVAGRMANVSLPPARFEAIKEVTLRGLKSYRESEARVLAQDRRDAMNREFHFLPSEYEARAARATQAEVQAFAKKFFGEGKLEAVVHGHMNAADAATLTRDMRKAIGFKPVADSRLLRRRHLDIAAKENVVDAGEIAGVNSAYIGDYVLAADQPKVRAAATVLANFLGEPFFTELRTKQQLGYIVGAQAPASHRQRYFTFVVQSSTHGPAELQKRAEAFIAAQPAELGKLSDEKWKTLVAGARSSLSAKPKSITEKADRFFDRAFVFGEDWERSDATLAALDTLTREEAVAILTTALSPESARRRTVLLHSKAHAPKDALVASFTDRAAWKKKRVFKD